MAQFNDTRAKVGSMGKERAPLRSSAIRRRWLEVERSGFSTALPGRPKAQPWQGRKPVTSEPAAG